MTRWQDQDRPVLEAIFEAENNLEGSKDIDGNAIAESLGIPSREFVRTVGLLYQDGLIDAIDVGTHSGPGFLIERVTPNGLRELGEWPTEEQLAQMLPEVLRLAAQDSKDEEASILRRGADILESVAAATMAALIRSATGLD